MVADLFGYNAVQIGFPQLDLLRNNRMPHRFCAGPAGAVTAHCLETALPFDSSSVDLVLIPHGLEFSNHPHQVLREVERILVPEGVVLVSGFNPLSLWGLRRMLSGGQGAFPWQGQYLSVARLKDWLALLGFEAQAVNFGCHQPPVAQQKWLERLQCLDRAGSRWWPMLGGVYVLQAVKRINGMRLIMPNWRESRPRTKSLAAATQQHGKAARLVDDVNHG